MRHRFGLNRPLLLAINILLVWLLPHQLGYFYADGRLKRLSVVQLIGTAAASLLVLALLTSLPIYSRNLLDNGMTVIGITAPTLPFIAISVWIVAGALAIRVPLMSWLARPSPWRVVSALNSVVMTVFLWHMTAYFAVVVILSRVGLKLPDAPDSTWWIERPLFLVLPAIPIAGLVWLFARFEKSAARKRLPGLVPKNLAI